MWPAVLDVLKGYSRVGWMAFAGSVPLSLEGGTLAVALDAAGKVKNVQESRHDERLRQAILDVVRADVRIDVVLAPDASAPTGPGPAPHRGAPAAGAPAAEADVPRIDDETLTEDSGVDLLIRELGATPIGEIEH